MSSSERQFVRRVAIAMIGLYCVVTSLLAVLKIGTSLFDITPWAEVVYGPAVTFGFSFAMFYAAVRIEMRVRRRNSLDQ